MIKLFKNQFLLFAFQAVILILIVGGFLPLQFIWFNFALVSIYIFLASPKNAILAFVLSLPLFVAVPNLIFDGFQFWRIFVLELVIAQAIKARWYRLTFPRLIQLLTNLPKWHYIWMAFLGFSLITSFYARFPQQVIRQVVFLLNIYILYFLVKQILKNRQDFIDLLKLTAVSLFFFVFLGYGQLVLTFFITQYYFWQGWAIYVSSVYYGNHLADILAYSNSWFSYTGEVISLRMFSVLPDSHSFSMLSALSIVFIVPLVKELSPTTYLYKTKKIILWLGIRLSGLAVVFSGTRGMWVGLLAPLLTLPFLYYKNILRPAVKTSAVALVLILVFFAASPFINQGLAMIRASAMQENIIDRVRSIYDFDETSNLGRIFIWEKSLDFAFSHPAGVGLGNFVVSLVDDISTTATYDQVGEEKNLKYNLPQKFVTAHSLYLQVLLEIGFVGAFLLFSLIVVFFSYAYSNLKKLVNDPTISVFALMAILVMAWFAAYGVFDITILNDRVLIVVFIMLAMFDFVVNKNSEVKNV